MGKSGAGTVIIVIVVVALAAFFIIPQLDFPSLDQITASIRQLFGGGGVADGFAAISFLVRYTDGTTETVPNIPQFSIVYNHKPISSVDVLVKGKINGSAITTWNTNTTVKIELYKGINPTPNFGSSANYVSSGSQWVNNDVKILATVPITQETLWDLMRAYGSGIWLLQVKSSIKLSATINGSLTDFSAQTPSGGLNIQLEA